MTIWFTADTHFGHAGIIRHRARPFSTVEAMDEGLIQAWNAVVRPRDTVWHLGDLAFGPRGTAERCHRRLNGRKHLIVGNHDGAEVRGLPWESVHDVAELHVDGVRLVMCHYPMLTWHGAARNRGAHVDAVMCHGHVHGTPSDPRLPHFDPCRLDVGVDMRGMAPVAVETLLEEARAGAALAAENGA